MSKKISLIIFLFFTLIGLAAANVENVSEKIWLKCDLSLADDGTAKTNWADENIGYSYIEKKTGTASCSFNAAPSSMYSSFSLSSDFDLDSGGLCFWSYYKSINNVWEFSDNLTIPSNLGQLGVVLYSSNAGQIKIGTWSTPTYSVALNTWFHFCATWDKGTARAYINGMLLSQNRTSGKLNSLWRFGKDTYAQQKYGYIDDVRLYLNHNLTHEEIQYIYNASFGTNLALDSFYNPISNISNTSSNESTTLTGVLNDFSNKIIFFLCMIFSIIFLIVSILIFIKHNWESLIAVIGTRFFSLALMTIAVNFSFDKLTKIISFGFSVLIFVFILINFSSLLGEDI